MDQGDQKTTFMDLFFSQTLQQKFNLEGGDLQTNEKPDAKKMINTLSLVTKQAA